MNTQPNQKKHKHISLGLFAHVDAGKTTLSEAMLYVTGAIRKQGRVDHGDSFLDSDINERNRGITIFSKQAELKYKDMEITLFDTPGHVDFSAEMERELAVIDYAVLVINGMDGVQSHTETLWRLMKEYNIPVFIFVNKMDMEKAAVSDLMNDIQHRLDEACVNFSVEKDNEFMENIALCDENAMEAFLKNGVISDGIISHMVADRQLFPVCFGSALRLFGIDELLEIICTYSVEKVYSDEFGARVFKITRDKSGTRLTHMRITGGRLVARQFIEEISQKVNQIRIYSGVAFTTAESVDAGRVCAVTGLDDSFAGQGFGMERERIIPIIEPVMTYRLLFDRGGALPSGGSVDEHTMLQVMKEIEEENPELNVLWDEKTHDIRVRIMGQIQLEIISEQVKARTGVPVEFDKGRIIYKETLEEPVLGVGHFEPLKHYSEVHLLMEPLERGSGLQFETDCSEDVLAGNWQRLIISHLKEQEYPGVLTGSAITDMKIMVVGGRAHPKHTEGGDFRQSVRRAVRQGLMMGRCQLLEPVVDFKMEVPVSDLGRAQTSLTCMKADFLLTGQSGDMAVIEGRAPVSEITGYQSELTAYTKGLGRLICTPAGYDICHNADEVIAEFGYNPDSDTEYPSSSVFCSHGAGYIVCWNQVYQYMHAESDYLKKEKYLNSFEEAETLYAGRQTNESLQENLSAELDEIFNRTYKSNEGDKRNRWNRKTGSLPAVSYGTKDKNKTDEVRHDKAPEDAKKYLLVDGYNIIFAWDDLKEPATGNLDFARTKLMDILSNYQGYTGCELILVFDAYKVKGNPGEISRYNNIYVVYTKEAETADMYIEKATHRLGKKHNVTVATSDGMEQLIIMGQGALRMSAQELKEEIERTDREMKEKYMSSKN